MIEKKNRNSKKSAVKGMIKSDKEKDEESKMIMYIYIYIYMCVCVCIIYIYMYREINKKEEGRRKKKEWSSNVFTKQLRAPNPSTKSFLSVSTRTLPYKGLQSLSI